MLMIPITDALDAIERNIKAFLVIAGEKPGYVKAEIDCYTGTASIRHSRNLYTKAIDCTVFLPAMESQAKIGKDELDRWIGYFIHELCHALYTDEVAWKQACVERLNDLVNGMEDVRIERKFNKTNIAANSKELLNALLAWCVDSLDENYDPNDVSNLAWLFAMVGRVELCGYDLPQAAPHMAKMTPAMRRLCDGVMAKLDKAKDTLDVLVIARELQAKLGGSNPGNGKAKTNPGKGKGGTGESEGKGEGKGDKPSGNCSGKAPEGEGEGEGEGEASDKPEGESGTGAGTGIGKPGELQGDVTKVNPVDLVPVSQERLDQAAEIMKRAGDAQTEANVIDAIRESNRRAGKPLPALDEARSSGSLVADSMKAAKMRAQVARVLKAEESESWDRGRASGRLDRFALARVGAGHIEGVYAKRHISGGYETEIDVLVDASGSMTGAPMHCATLLAYVIAQAAQQVGVKCQVSLFSSMTATPRVAKATNESPSSKSVQRRFGEMAKGTNGSTPLTRSIIEIATKLAARSPQKRKMLFVVSDGGCDNGPGAVRKACDYAERLDVETVALCIDTAPHKGFKLAVRCNSANIAEAGLGVLVKALSREL